MRKLRSMFVVSLMVVASCSSSSEPMAVQITGPLGPSGGSVPVTGPAVDEGVMCDVVTYEEGDFFDLDGNAVTDEERDQLMQVEEETGEEVFSAKDGRWTCSDGSGTFETVEEFTLASRDYDFDGSNDAATWTVENGTGDYEDLAGSGNVVVDFSKMTVVYDGEIQK
ncbi:MAG: hypothetical protein WBN35_05560 [Acidimicrobiia bacterium]